jgi:hypothetical protein
VASGVEQASCTATYIRTGKRCEECDFVFGVCQYKGCHIVTPRGIVVFVSAVVKTRNHVITVVF